MAGSEEPIVWRFNNIKTNLFIYAMYFLYVYLLFLFM